MGTCVDTSLRCSLDSAHSWQMTGTKGWLQMYAERGQFLYINVQIIWVFNQSWSMTNLIHWQIIKIESYLALLNITMKLQFTIRTHLDCLKTNIISTPAHGCWLQLAGHSRSKLHTDRHRHQPAIKYSYE